MRVVLNTNIVISALLWRGKPYQLLETISHSHELRLFASPALLEELADVLARPMATKRLALIGKTAAEVLADYQAVVEVVEPSAVPRVVLRDVDDDQVIAAAFAAQWGGQSVSDGNGSGLGEELRTRKRMCGK